MNRQINNEIGHTKIINKESSGLHWWQVIDNGMLRRAAVVTVVLGSILTLINQSGWVFGSDSLQKSQIILVFIIPFFVVNVAQILGKGQTLIDAKNDGVSVRTEGFMATMISHGIPGKAVGIGLFFGSVNLVVTLTGTVLGSGDITTFPVVPMLQAYTLPVLFGLLSQTISYRRFHYQEFNI